MVTPRSLLKIIGLPILAACSLQGAVQAQSVSQRIAWDAPYLDPKGTLFKYKVVVSKNGGPESARYVDAATWTNGISYVEFSNLDPASTYTYKIAALYKKSLTGSEFFQAEYSPTITFAAASLNPADTNAPQLTLDRTTSVTLDERMSISGTLSDESPISALDIGGNAEVSAKEYVGTGGAWNAELRLREGLNTITVGARDTHGNATNTTFSVYRVPPEGPPGTPLVVSSFLDENGLVIRTTTPFNGLYTLERALSLEEGWQPVQQKTRFGHTLDFFEPANFPQALYRISH